MIPAKLGLIKNRMDDYPCGFFYCKNAIIFYPTYLMTYIKLVNT